MCGRSLAREDLVIVAVVRRASTAGLIALRCRVRDQVAERARLFTRLRRPVQAIFLSRLADNALRIGGGASAGARDLGIVILRIDVGEEGLDRVQFVVADAAEQDFLQAGFGIKAPTVV